MRTEMIKPHVLSLFMHWSGILEAIVIISPRRNHRLYLMQLDLVAAFPAKVNVTREVHLGIIGTLGG